MSKESSPEKKESDEEDVNLFSRIKEKARLNSRPSISIVEVEELLSGVKEDELEEDEGSEEEGFEEED